MLPRFALELASHDPGWTTVAARETARLQDALGDALVGVHHVGSTAVPGIVAKPIVDLLPVVRSLEAIDARQSDVEALGYLWCGEYGIAKRRYCVLVDPASGQRIAQVHAFPEGSSEIARHVTFRDYLRARPDEAAAYEAVKRDALARANGDGGTYNELKTPWIRACELRAAAWASAPRP